MIIDGSYFAEISTLQGWLLCLRGGGGTAIYGLYRYEVCAAVKGMVFKQFRVYKSERLTLA